MSQLNVRHQPQAEGDLWIGASAAAAEVCLQFARGLLTRPNWQQQAAATIPSPPLTSWSATARQWRQGLSAASSASAADSVSGPGACASSATWRSMGPSTSRGSAAQPSVCRHGVMVSELPPH